jgi:hypothetical protein
MSPKSTKKKIPRKNGSVAAYDKRIPNGIIRSAPTTTPNHQRMNKRVL